MKRNNILIASIIILPCFLFAQNQSMDIEGQPEFKLNIGHESVSAVKFSPDGKYVISGGNYDKTIKLWEVTSGKELRTFSGHSDKVESIDISPDGKYIISGGWDKTIKLWEVNTGKLIRTYTGHKYYVETVCFSPDGKYIASCGSDGSKLWDVSSGMLVKEFEHGSNACAFSPDGKYLVAGNEYLYLFDISTGLVVREFHVHSGQTNTIAFSPDGKYLASGSDDKTIKICEVSTGSVSRVFTIVPLADPEIVWSESIYGSVLTIGYSPDGKYLASAGCDMMVRLWDINSGEEIKSYAAYKTTPVFALTFSPDGKSLLIGSGNGKICQLDVETGANIKIFAGASRSVWAVNVSRDGKYMAVNSSETMNLWDLGTGSLITAMSGYKANYNSVRFSVDGNYIVFGCYDNTIKIWDLHSMKIIKMIAGLPGSSVFLTDFSPDGNYVVTGNRVTGSSHSNIKMWNVHTENVVQTFDQDSYILESVCFSPDGKYVLSGGTDNTQTGKQNIILWDIANRNKKMVIDGRRNYHRYDKVSISPDGKYIAGKCMIDSVIMLWDAESGNLIKFFEGHHRNISADVKFSQNGKYLVSGSDDNTVKIWDVLSGKEIKTLSGHSGAIHSVDFLPDGKHVVSGSGDGSIRLWNIETGEWIAFINSKDDSQWLIYTFDGYWDGSNNSGELVGMVKGMSGLNIDQFAIRNNRPDIILQRLGSKDSELITHYHNQFLKRLRKLNITEAQLNGDYQVPEARILSGLQNGKFFQLQIALSDSKYNLKSYNIYVNDNPLFGAYGKKIDGQKLELTENLELISGSNKIEVSCMNENGAESFRVLTTAIYSQPVKGNLYFLGFGVSKYQNSTYNLQFADKDAYDLEKVMQNFKGKGFENVYTKVLVNEQVTPDAISAAREFVKNAGVDDTFVLFIAGHGLHDTNPEATYYFMTSNADLKNLKGTAADFETIEDLLQGIPPRNKLFLMDACESGEIDEEEQGQMIASASGVGIKSRGFKMVQGSSEMTQGFSPRRTYLHQKDRYIYNDLLRRSGAIVFSSSKGGELSYERNDLKNGLFTEYIMKALTTSEADKDINGIISTDELREYVSAQVAKASGDLQHPTVDRDNIYQKFGFQIK